MRNAADSETLRRGVSRPADPSAEQFLARVLRLRKLRDALDPDASVTIAKDGKEIGPAATVAEMTKKAV